MDLKIFFRCSTTRYITSQYYSLRRDTEENFYNVFVNLPLILLVADFLSKTFASHLTVAER
jgi:hypothetical protein